MTADNNIDNNDTELSPEALELETQLIKSIQDAIDTGVPEKLDYNTQFAAGAGLNDETFALLFPNIKFVKLNDLRMHNKWRTTDRLERVERLVKQACRIPARRTLEPMLLRQVSAVSDALHDGYCVLAMNRISNLISKLMGMRGDEMGMAREELEKLREFLYSADKARKAHVGRRCIKIQHQAYAALAERRAIRASESVVERRNRKSKAESAA